MYVTSVTDIEQYFEKNVGWDCWKTPSYLDIGIWEFEAPDSAREILTECHFIQSFRVNYQYLNN